MSTAGLRIKIKSIGKDIRRLILRGAIDGHTAKTLERAIRDVMANDIRKIILDFRRVSYMGSAGVGVIISCKTLLEELFPDKPSEIVVLNPIDTVRDVFNLLEISETIRMAETDEEAVKVLAGLE